MGKASEQYAYFTISGDFDPDWISSRLRCLPTEAWRKGDLHPRNRRERQCSRWSLHSRLPHQASIEEHIADVLVQMEQNPDAFCAVAEQFDGCMQLVGYLHDGYQGLILTRPMMQAMGRYGLKMDADLYWLWADSREDTQP